MRTTVNLDKRHFGAAAQRARLLGKTTERYIESLIDADMLTFDEILAPGRQGFATGGASDAELDGAVRQARKSIHAPARRKPRKRIRHGR